MIPMLVTSLVLPDMDGTDLAAFAREQSTQSYFPIIEYSRVVAAATMRMMKKHGLGCCMW